MLHLWLQSLWVSIFRGWEADLGLVSHLNHKLAWGSHCGRFRWLPYFIKKLIVTVWNRTACAVWGHNDLMFHINIPEEPIPHCVDCCAALTHCTCKEGGESGSPF